MKIDKEHLLNDLAYVFGDKDYFETLKKVIENQPECDEWISVKDKPVPTDDMRYIVCAWYHGKAEVECSKGWACKLNVAHWMPLPKPPKEKKE